MHTLFDVLTRARHSNEVRAPDGWPPGLLPKSRLRIPDGGHVVLPKQLNGFEVWESLEARVEIPARAEVRQEARAALLTRPGFMAPMPPPSTEELVALGSDPSVWRNERCTHFIAAVAFVDGTSTFFGVSQSVVIENALGFGASLIIAHQEEWFNAVEEFADELARRVMGAVGLVAAPEGDSPEWTDAMFLLNDASKEGELPPGWRTALQRVAGLYALALTIHANAWGTKTRVLHDLRSSPPRALLVSDRSIPAPDAFLSVYRAARPSGYGEVLGTLRAGSFDEQAIEIGMHLRDFVPLPLDDGGREEPFSEIENWKQAKAHIEAIVGDHFALTDRALVQLTSNPYPDPRRMVRHVVALEQIALDYHVRRGDLGKRLEEAGREKEIEIALFDASLGAKTAVYQGSSYESVPHVKVDDFKAPDKCGRIYFAMDGKKFRFIVDHIGLHDY